MGMNRNGPVQVQHMTALYRMEPNKMSKKLNDNRENCNLIEWKHALVFSQSKKATCGNPNNDCDWVPTICYHYERKNVANNISIVWIHFYDRKTDFFTWELKKIKMIHFLRIGVKRNVSVKFFNSKWNNFSIPNVVQLQLQNK